MLCVMLCDVLHVRGVSATAHPRAPHARAAAAAAAARTPSADLQGLWLIRRPGMGLVGEGAMPGGCQCLAARAQRAQRAGVAATGAQEARSSKGVGRASMPVACLRSTDLMSVRSWFS